MPQPDTWKQALQDRMLPQLLSPDCQLAVIADSGQKHLIFKARPGWWQLEEQTIRPDRARFLEVHALIRRLAGMGFSQSAIASGNYPPGLMLKMNILQLRKFQEIEAELSRHRGCDVFDLAIKFWKHDIHERANS
ncbi:MAG: hypothetical protein D6765_12220 [Bacteroidetes bacterium]|nr:MAG: hypothetical protein D6765_12220 [Bacteroidota bacterium]